MFFEQINCFKEILAEVVKRLECIEENQREILAKVQIVEISSKNQCEKFQACAMSFRQIKIVTESLVDRLDEIGGTLTNIDYD